ncbi:hypothetical protein B0G80_1672 [Paraburkholderia sp. BL6669N2]|uniref:hypothetical protein n=1 Tax=Paraburkholderia sp. BL6669N2 TaxID=1938807 RepID=UPI000E3A73DF|nr:hypothetical protein [Paraburkholderia sp. BL6669N2]REG58947.1 hypothetical protein B0G80_1672 [Paraburkholderia sp. BL6669N2]
MRQHAPGRPVFSRAAKPGQSYFSSLFKLERMTPLNDKTLSSSVNFSPLTPTHIRSPSGAASVRRLVTSKVIAMLKMSKFVMQGATCLAIVVASHVQAQFHMDCVSSQQHSDSEQRIAAMTRGFDMQALGANLLDAMQKRNSAAGALRDCRATAVLGLGCDRQIGLYNVADAVYQNALEEINGYQTILAAQANARSMQAPVCH